MKKLMSFVAAAFLSLATTANALVHYEDKVLTITGVTTDLQVQEIYSKTLNKPVDIVKMSGPGGSFYAGLRLGHLIKKFDALVIVPENTSCMSACAMAAIASDVVSVQGVMGFHRPYAMAVDAFRTPDQLAASYTNQVVFPTIHYMDKYRVPLKFTRDMFQFTSPCKFLTFSSTTILKGSTNFMMYNTQSNCQRLNEHVSY